MEDLAGILKSVFGYDSFRGEQETIIRYTLSGQSSLVIMPTGGGKSLCYQLPALVTKGTTIVISPLIALMQDQVDALRANGIPAAALNSSISSGEVPLIVQRIGTEQLKLLYVSPEKAITPAFIELVRNKQISLVAVDESHCVSVWGNDFRKDYTYIPQLLENLAGVPVMALTATADRATQKDIAEKLALKRPKIFITSFERANLSLSVEPGTRRAERLVRFVRDHSDESGIVYCLSRKSTETIAGQLQAQNIQAAYYHADMSAADRQRIQRDFQLDKIRVICATIAFGMGIDKSNVRYVLHYNLPKNLESYYQEIGRAGRDGLPARTILYFSMADAQVLRQFIDRSESDDKFKLVQRSKLARMIEFGQSTSCRTNMILSYFGEHRSKPCGHCDNCSNPPDTFDGTELAQKALSAIYRSRERVAINMLSDILRGSEKSALLRMNFHKIKTYGAGKDTSREDWLFYISQMVNQGLLEIDFTNYNILKITGPGHDVLFRNSRVFLTRKSIEKSLSASRHSTEEPDNSLLAKLRTLRTSLARAEGLPPYTVFHDSTLEEMASTLPKDLEALAAVNGVGTHKLRKYGDRFIKLILNESNLEN